MRGRRLAAAIGLLLIVGLVALGLLWGGGPPDRLWVREFGFYPKVYLEPDGEEFPGPVTGFPKLRGVDVLAVDHPARFPTNLFAEAVMKLYGETGRERETPTGTWREFHLLDTETIWVRK